ncbi:MAG TPA: hypothetical protein VN043_09825 [Rhodanobacter sp.]|nr:hypothetical protein [Rhodanobacter sp.]
MSTPLPPTDPPATDDQLPGETELAALYRQLPQDEPGPALDAAVLKAAAQALDRRSNPLAVERRRAPRERGDWVHPKFVPSGDIGSIGLDTGPRRRVPRWVLALGSAASLVLVAGVAWHMRGMPAENKPSSARQAAPAPPPVSEDAAIATAKSDAPASPPEATKPAPLRAVAAPAAIDKNAGPAAAGAGLQMGNMTPPAPLPPGMKVRSGTAPFALAERQSTAADASLRKATREAVMQKRAASAPRQPASGNALTTRLSATALQEAAPAPPAPPAASAPDDDSTTAANPADTPTQELAKIRQLVQQQRSVEARQRLQAFHQAHPQWKLPAELRSLLQEP